MKRIGFKSYNDYSSLVYAVLFSITGLLLFLNPDGLVKFIAYIFGGILIITGTVKVINYNRLSKKNIVVNSSRNTLGIISIIIGITIILSSSMIDVAIRLIMGFWILLSGVNKLSMALELMKNKNNYITLLMISIFLVIVGLYIILKANLVFSLVGLLIMIYGIIEIIGYINYNLNQKK